MPIACLIVIVLLLLASYTIFIRPTKNKLHCLLRLDKTSNEITYGSLETSQCIPFEVH